MSDPTDREPTAAPLGGTADDHAAPPWDAFDGSDRERWAGDEQPGRTRRLLVLAAIPWLVVAVLGARTLSAPSGSPEEQVERVAAPGPTPSEDRGSQGADDEGHHTTDDDSVEDEGAVLPAVGLRSGARVAPGPSDASAVALVVARTWLGDIGPEPTVEVGAADGPPVYVEHLAVEAVDLPTADTAVVTVLAIVLDVEDGSYTDARTVRLGVPIALTAEGAHPADEPWPLPAPDLTVRSPSWTPVDDPDALAAAGRALGAAGYRDVSVQGLARSASWPLQVTATAVGPGDETTREHRIWLRDHLGDLVVAGALPGQQEDRP